MSLSIILWISWASLALVAISLLSWYSLRHIQRATHADALSRAEQHRVLRIYAKLRDGRVYDPRRYPETIYSRESGGDSRR